MPAKAIPFLYAAIFGVILVNVVPKKDLHRLFIYGLIFGGILDIIFVGFANLIGEFQYINYEPFGLMGIHFMAPISWTIYFMIYFYFLPEKKLYRVIYTLAGILYSMVFCQMITKLGVLKLTHGIVDSTVPFVIWFPLATWGYEWLIQKDFPKPAEKWR